MEPTSPIAGTTALLHGQPPSPGNSIRTALHTPGSVLTKNNTTNDIYNDELHTTQIDQRKVSGSFNNLPFLRDGRKPSVTTRPVAPVENRTTEPAAAVAVRKTLSIADLHAMEIPVKTCLLQPYNPKGLPIEHQGIARPVHGLLHACRVSTWALALLQLRKELNDPAALNFPDEMVPLLIQACLYHNSGREGDGPSQPEWERASGNNLAEHLRNSGHSQQIAWQCSEAVRLKQHPERCRQLPEPIQTLRSLLHDADILDAMRVHKSFYMDRLDCFQHCSSETERKRVRELAIDVCQTIAAQGDLYSRIALQDHKGSTDSFYQANRWNCETTRICWEHHPHPLCNQLLHISHRSERLERLLTPYVAGLKEEQSPFSLSKLQRVDNALDDCKTEATGKYIDPDRGDCWQIKQVNCHEDAINQALMANLARELGLKIPETFTHEEDGKQFVVSRWLDALEGGEQTLAKMPREQWAKLLLINVILGNSNWKNVEVDTEGNPVLFDWSWAGLASRYRKNRDDNLPREDDFSSMPVLLKKLRDPDAPNMSSHPIDVACQPILATLSDAELSTALRTILVTLDANRLNRLLEQSGFRAGDRTWLRQTLWDRIAWLSTRFPDSRDGEIVSEAEYRAIEAAGTRGGWLQVNDTDIPSGQLCVEELLDGEGSPQTRMTLRLSRDACWRLSDHMAIEQGLHRLQLQIKYFNETPKTAYREWRGDMSELQRECRTLISALDHDRERWHREDRPNIDRLIENLTVIAERAELSLQLELPDSIERFPLIPDRLPAPAFPARVTSQPTTQSEGMVQLAEHSHGFTKLTGKKVSYFNQHRLEIEHLERSPVSEINLQTGTDLSIQFRAENLPQAQSFERKLVIEHPGHSKRTVEMLFGALQELGVRTDRADNTDLENRWLDRLADYYCCRETMQGSVAANASDAPGSYKKRLFLASRLGLKPEQLDWECHVRIRSGRLTFYRPGLPHEIDQSPEALYCPSHNLSFASQQRGQAKMFGTMLNNEASLSSFVRRSDIGIEPFGTSGGLMRQVKLDGGDATFTRIKQKYVTNQGIEADLLTVQMKPSVLGRLDATVFQNEASFNSDYGGLEAYRRNQRQRPGTANEYQRLSTSDRDQETLYAMPLSLFDELDTLTIASDNERQQLLRTLKQRHSHWPDGRTMEAVIQYSVRQYYFELLHYRSETPLRIKHLLETCGLENFESIVKNNPDVLQGKLINLDGLSFSGNRMLNFEAIDFRECSMNGTRLNEMHFVNCQLTTKQLNSAQLQDVHFIYCAFEGERFSKELLNNATFTVPAAYRKGDLAREKEVIELSRILHDSCLESNDSRPKAEESLNLGLWLDVLIRNKSLCEGRRQLDPNTLGLISKYNRRIKKEHPEKLPELIETILPLEFNRQVEAAKRFVDKNPNWYIRVINSLYSIDFQSESSKRPLINHPETLLEWVEQDIVMKWMTHFPDSVLCMKTESSVESDQSSAAAKFSHLQQHYPDLAVDAARTIESSAQKLAEGGQSLNPLVFEAVDHLKELNILTEEQQRFWVRTLTTCEESQVD